jgi:hypothetical protein
MNRVWLGLLVILAGFTWSLPAMASGDIQCAPDWKLGHGSRSGCDEMVILQPGNDTRTNLLLLLSDNRASFPVRPASVPVDPLFDWEAFRDLHFPRKTGDDSGYAEGEGSRCRSNGDGSARFLAALRTSKASEEDRQILADARAALQPDCAGASVGAATVTEAVAKLRSDEGKSFGSYLLGILGFYDADYDAARTQFAALAKARNGWLHETALYMLGRVELNRAQVDAFDEYGYRKTDHPVDPQTVAAAERGLNAYLKAYPSGLYATSARGLLRRVYWLGGDMVRLAAEYQAAFVRPLPGPDDGRLAEEVDDKLLGSMTDAQIQSPILLAVYDLQHMRVADSTEDADYCCGTPITMAALDGQRAAFAKDGALFEYLRAAYAWYIAKKPAEVLKLIPDAARQTRFSAVEFSRQMLRGMALEATKDRNARGFWLEMLPGAQSPYQRSTLELALALHDERAGALGRIFEAASPVKTPSIREILLMNVAGPDLLRQQAKNPSAPQHERDVALFTLLYKSLSRGGYAGFVADQALVPGGASADLDYWSLLDVEKPPVGLFTQSTSLGDYGCPALKLSASQLAKDKTAAKPLLCVADFLRANGFDGIALDTQPSADQLGGTPTSFP